MSTKREQYLCRARPRRPGRRHPASNFDLLRARYTNGCVRLLLYRPDAEPSPRRPRRVALDLHRGCRVRDTTIASDTLEARPGGTRALDHSLVHGLAWTGAAKGVAQALSWASTLVVARLLTPDDYGLVGMASVYLGLITLLSEFGLGATVVTLRSLSTEQVAQLNTLSLLFGLASFAVSCAVAVPLGHFFHAPQLPPVVIALSAAFVISAFKTVPLALLQRDLQFKRLALIDTAQAGLLALVMIGFALVGLRYWTLVLGVLLGSLGSTVTLLVLRPHAFAWPRKGSLGHAVTFSWHLIVTRLSWYTYSNADFLVAGRILGKTALGVYDFGWTLANVPVEKITALVTQVTPAFFSAVQTDYAALRRYLLRLTEGIALITFPTTVGLLLVAREFIMYFLGAKWEGTIAPLELLAAYAGFRSIVPLLPQLLMTTGESRFNMLTAAASACVLPAGFYVMGSRWGTVGLGWAWVIIYPFLVFPLYWRVFHKISLPVSAYVRALWPALSCTLIMSTLVLAVRYGAPATWPLGARLGAEVVTGGVAYASAALWLHRERLQAFASLVQRARRGPA
jgi:O-antigen/teichoic acid export membrane protein